MVNIEKYKELHQKLSLTNTSLIAVSKFKSVEDITALYNLGHRDFGENYVQELIEKQAVLPEDIRWHFIGHLQTNKVKYIVPFVTLIQSVDSEKILKEIDKQAAKNQRKIKVLLQVHIAEEQTKFGFNEQELMDLDFGTLTNTEIVGLMGMATFTDENEKLTREFKYLQSLYQKFSEVKNLQFNNLSMGMSDDFELAISCGSNMVRIGSLLFGRRS